MFFFGETEHAWIKQIDAVEILLIRFVSLVLVVFVSACQTAYINGKPNENSPYYKVPVHSKLVLNRELTIPAKQDEVHFQSGRTMQWYGVNRYFPYCRLTLRTKKDVPQTVRTDEFVIHEVKQQFEYTVDGGFIRLASSRSGFIQFAASGGRRRAYEVVATRLALRSERQPDVVNLTCASWELTQNLPNVTIRDIRETLRDIFTLQLAE